MDQFRGRVDTLFSFVYQEKNEIHAADQPWGTRCGGSLYKAAFQGYQLLYVTLKPRDAVGNGKAIIDTGIASK